MNTADQNGWTVLTHAAAEGNFECVDLLLAARADVNHCTGGNGCTALMVAVCMSGIEARRISCHQCINRLIQAGADVNKLDEFGYTVLVKAAENGDVKCVETLIDAGARVNGHSGGSPALVRASMTGHFRCIKLLLLRGADVNSPCFENELSPLNAAVFLRESQIKESMEKSLRRYVPQNHSRRKCIELLIEAGADVNARSGKPDTFPLYLAAQNGFAECVSALLQAGASVNIATENRRTALMASAIEGHDHCLKMLLHEGVDIISVHKDIALIFAADNGHSKCVDLLMRAGANVNFSGISAPPLIMASIKGHLDCVVSLIKAGADVNTAEEKGNDSALIAAAKGGSTDCVKSLIQAGADVNRADKKGYTALLHASSLAHYKCVNVLVQTGADVNHVAKKDGITALISAVRNPHGLCHEEAKNIAGVDKLVDHSHEKCVELLIQAGADINSRTAYRYTALTFATQNDHDKCVELLVAEGADVNEALVNAARSGSERCLDLLVKLGADVNAFDCYGYTAIMAAALNGHNSCVSSLIEAGADVNMESATGYTALMYASVYGRTKSTCALLNAGADVNMVDRFGYTALIEAASRDHVKCMKKLLKANALVNLADGSRVEDCKKMCTTHFLNAGKLLLAAGEIMEDTEDFQYSNLLELVKPKEVNLMSMCRRAIRNHLINIDPHLNLIVRIRQLELPSELKDYLLFDAWPEKANESDDEDGDDDDDDDNDDDGL